MSAIVDTITLYQAVCVGCGWWGEQVESEYTASDDMQEHNEEEHGEAR